MEPLATFGPYTLLRAIAATRDSVSFAARFEAAKDGQYILALKVLLPTMFDNPGFADALVDHLKLATRLNHVNVAQVFDYGQHEDLGYVALEFVDGVPVALVQEAVAPGQKAVTTEVAAFVCAEACAGLAYAHGRRDERGNVLGIVHSRVSPRTVLLSKSGLVKLVDFGLARSLTDLTILPPDDYELNFVAPEIARGEEFDGRADVFSVGSIAFMLLTGTMIYGDSTGEDLETKARRGYVPAVLDVDPSVPAPLAELVDKALASDPDERFADATELRSGLAAWLRRNSPGFGRHRLRTYLNRLLPESVYGLLPDTEWEALHRKNFVFCDPDSRIAESVTPVDGVTNSKDALAPFLESPELPHLERLDVASMATGAHHTVHEAATRAARVEGDARPRRGPTPPTMASVSPIPVPEGVEQPELETTGDAPLYESGEVDKAFDSISMNAVEGPDDDASGEARPSPDEPESAPEAATPAAAAVAMSVDVDPDLVYDDSIDFETQRSVVAEAVAEARTTSPLAIFVWLVLALALLAGLGVGAKWYIGQQSAEEDVVATPTSVFVTSRPQGASIVVDGLETGLRTPAPIDDLPTGAVSVSVTLQGFDPPQGQTFDPTDAPAQLAFELVPAEHRIRVDSEPQGADVVYEGDVIGTTPTVVGPLRVDYRQGVDVILRLAGYLDERVTVDWAPGEGESSVRRPLQVDPDYVPPEE